MYDFIDRLVTQVLPRVTEFDGLKQNSIHGKGDFALGIRDLSYFPEVEAQHGSLRKYGLADAPGLGVFVRTTAQSPDEARLLLSALRFPFRTSR